jgi:glc operon protein GlcG
MGMADVIMEAAVKDAMARGVSVAIVIVDQTGDIVAARRMDGALPAVFEIARRKAWTSAFSRRPTKEISDDAAAGRGGILPSRA